jgi:hypothetical protein
VKSFRRLNEIHSFKFQVSALAKPYVSVLGATRQGVEKVAELLVVLGVEVAAVVVRVARVRHLVHRCVVVYKADPFIKNKF